MGGQANAYAKLASGVIKDARACFNSWRAFMAALEPAIGPISQDTLEGWVKGKHGARADVFLAAAEIAGYELREQILRKRLEQLDAKAAALRQENGATD